MAQQVKNMAGKFGGKSISALVGLAGFGYAATQSFYSGKYLNSDSIDDTGKSLHKFSLEL
jgi:hypothetical protein